MPNLTLRSTGIVLNDPSFCDGYAMLSLETPIGKLFVKLKESHYLTFTQIGATVLFVAELHRSRGLIFGRCTSKLTMVYEDDHSLCTLSGQGNVVPEALTAGELILECQGSIYVVLDTGVELWQNAKALYFSGDVMRYDHVLYVRPIKSAMKILRKSKS